MGKVPRIRRRKSRLIRKETSAPLISRVEVHDLFYTYTYDLRLSATSGAESGKLLLLYGNNGSGKTTILNLLYHLLHPEPYGGHRTYVGGIPFTLFKVYLLDGIIITASRNSPDPGPYQVYFENRRDKYRHMWNWIPETRRGSDGNEKYIEYCNRLSDLELSFHYLRDTRRVEDREMPESSNVARRLSGLDIRWSISADSDRERDYFSPDHQIILAVEAAMQWFRQRALAATNIGYTSVNAIYRDIIGRIVSAPSSVQDRGNVDESNPTKLIKDLEDLNIKTNKFAQLGLTPQLNAQEIVKYLRSAKPHHFQLLSTVLDPYIEGHAARLEALGELQRVMSSYVSLLREFYSHKKVDIHLEEGLKITAEKGHSLTPTQLSSGEKQLLLLFSNAISSRRDRTILIIDEPEISLNVRWQRKLIPALLTCLSGTSFQLILATHSIELLAQYRDSVTPLDNIE